MFVYPTGKFPRQTKFPRMPTGIFQLKMYMYMFFNVALPFFFFFNLAYRRLPLISFPTYKPTHLKRSGWLQLTTLGGSTESPRICDGSPTYSNWHELAQLSTIPYVNKELWGKSSCYNYVIHCVRNVTLYIASADACES